MSLESLPSLPIPIGVSNTIETQDFTNTGYPAITGLTCSLTPITFSVNLTATSELISNDTIVWDTGDGHVYTGKEITHTYNWPGEYTVYMTYIDKNGTTKRSSMIKKVRAYNYLDDRVYWITPGTENCYLDKLIACRLSERFTLYRTNSWQSYDAHAEQGYTINLYVSGSDSAPLMEREYLQEKYIHFQRTWRYVKSDNDRTPITDITTSTDHVYIKKLDLSANGGFIETYATDPDGVFVGSTGTAGVHYIDDSAKNVHGNNTPIFLYATIDMSRFGDTYSNTQAINSGSARSTGLSYVEHHRTVLPVKVLFNQPTQLLFTPNGIKEFQFATNKLQGTHIPITASLADFQGNVINSFYPELTYDYDAVDLNYVKLGTTNANRDDNPLRLIYWKNENIQIATYGSYSGVLSTCDTTGCTETCRITGEVVIQDPPFYDFPEITNIYVADVLSGELFNYKIKYRFPDEYSFFHNMTLSYNLPSIKKSIGNIETPGMSAVLGIAINGNGEAWIADGDVDRICKINPCGNVTYNVPISTYMPGVLNSSPVGIAVDGESDFYFSSTDVVSAFKVNGVSSELMTVMLPDIQGEVINGDQTIQPGPIETRVDNKVWIGYTHPLSTFLGLYENDGTFIDRYALPPAMHPVDILCDPYNNAWVLGAGPDKENGLLVHVDHQGTIMHTITGIPMPGSLAMDHQDNIWFSYGANKVRKISTKTYRRMFDMEIGSRYSPPYDFISAIEGITNDLEGNILIIHNLDKKLYIMSSENPYAHMKSYDVPSKQENRIQAFGDWSGGRWINKYGRAVFGKGRIRRVFGLSNEIKMLPQSGCEDIAKYNEDYDFGNTVQTYCMQPVIGDSTFFKEQFINSTFGDYYSYPWEFGKVIYEKIANFVDNNSDIDTCNLRNVYSLGSEVGYTLEDYNYVYPGRLRRTIDMVSISHKKLFGDRSKDDTNYDKRGVEDNPNYGVNLGKQLDTYSYIVTAGVPIVANEYYGAKKTKIIPLVVAGNETDPGWSEEHQGLVNYPLTSYDDSWGWGLSIARDGYVYQYYSFYEHVEQFQNDQLEGVVDWSNWYSTLSEKNSSYQAWTEQDGIMETLIDTSIKFGLDLVHPCETGDPPTPPKNLYLEPDREVVVHWTHDRLPRKETEYYRIYRSTDGVKYEVVGLQRQFSKDAGGYHISWRDNNVTQCETSWYKIAAVNKWGEQKCVDPPEASLFVNEYHALNMTFVAGPPTPTPTAPPILTPTPVPTEPGVRWQQPRVTHISELATGELVIERIPGSLDTIDIFVQVHAELVHVQGKFSAAVRDFTKEGHMDITTGLYRIPAGEDQVSIPVKAYGDMNDDEESEVYLVRVADVYSDTGEVITLQGYDFAAVSIIDGPQSVPDPTPTPTAEYELFKMFPSPTPTSQYEQFHLWPTPTPTYAADEWDRCVLTPTPTLTVTPTPTPTPTPTWGTPDTPLLDVDCICVTPTPSPTPGPIDSYCLTGTYAGSYSAIDAQIPVTGSIPFNGVTINYSTNVFVDEVNNRTLIQPSPIDPDDGYLIEASPAMGVSFYMWFDPAVMNVIRLDIQQYEGECLDEFETC